MIKTRKKTLLIGIDLIDNKLIYFHSRWENGDSLQPLVFILHSFGFAIRQECII